MATSRTTLPFQPKNEPNRSGIAWPVSLISCATSSWTTIAAPNVVTSHAMFVAGSNWPSGSIATRSNTRPTTAASRTVSTVTRIIDTLRSKAELHNHHREPPTTTSVPWAKLTMRVVEKTRL